MIVSNVLDTDTDLILIPILPSKPSLVSAFIMGLVWCVSESIGPGSAILTKLFHNAHPVASTMAILGLLNFFGIVLAKGLPRKEEMVEHTLHAA